MNNRLYSTLLLLLKSCANGLLFVVPFLWDNFFFLIFVAFVSFFVATNKLKTTTAQLWYSLILVAVWCFVTIHWMHSDSTPLWSTILIIFILCAIAFVPFVVYFCGITRLCIKQDYKYLLFILVWISVECLSFEWELAFPLLTLGYYLGNVPMLIHWYQYTGVLGGSVWILLVNIAIMKWCSPRTSLVSKWGYTILSVIPLLLSLVLHCIPIHNERSEKIMVVTISGTDTLCCNRTPLTDVLSRLSDSIGKDAFLAILPESVCYLPASSFPYNSYFSTVKRMLKSQAPQTNVILGATTQDVKNGASFNRQTYFNLALCIDSSGLVNFRNKARLVPFGEFIPYKTVFGKIPHIEQIVTTSLSYKNEYDTIFTFGDTRILPLICYELYFSNLIAKYAKKQNINLIVTLSNDYIVQAPIFAQQFIRMARVQAISFQKSVVKSTKQGISFIIAPQGKMLATSEFNTSEIITAQVPINHYLTLFGLCGNSMVYVFWLILFFLLFTLNYYDKKRNTMHTSCV